MSDLHPLPLLGHDLPEYAGDIAMSREEWLSAQKKARVYRIGPSCWTWDHWCSWKNHESNGYPHKTQETAFWYAWNHMKRCVG